MKRERAPDPLAQLGLAAADLRIESVPAQVVQCCKQRVLDTIGCMVAGYHAGIADAIRSYVLGILTKCYATVGCMTVALDETFDLVTQHDIKADDIVEIHVECMRRLAIFNTRHPENELAARASLPYCLAVAVCTRDRSQLLGPAFRAELLADKTIRAAADKVRMTVNEDYERQYPARSLARVTLRLRNGESYSQEGDRSARARYLTPTDQDIEEKFRLIATPVLGRSKTDRVVALVQKFETLDHVRELIDALCVNA